METLSELIKHQANITAVFKNGYNSMQYAAILGYWDCVSLLIEKSYDLLQSDWYWHRIGQAFLLAAKENKTSILIEFFKLIESTKQRVKVIINSQPVTTFETE